MSTSSTTVFNTYAAFLSLVTTQLAAITDPVWSVFDGDPVDAKTTAIAAVLGWEGHEQTPAGIGAGSPSFPLDEEFSIIGRLYTFTGATDQSIPRAQIATAYTAIETGVRTDPTLGGLVHWSYFGTSDYEQAINDQGGRSAQIDIYLNCRNRIQ